MALIVSVNTNVNAPARNRFEIIIQIVVVADLGTTIGEPPAIIGGRRDGVVLLFFPGTAALILGEQLQELEGVVLAKIAERFVARALPK
jgi:hypothetical protein